MNFETNRGKQANDSSSKLSPHVVVVQVKGEMTSLSLAKKDKERESGLRNLWLIGEKNKSGAPPE